MEKGAARDLMKFNSNKCKLASWGKRKPLGLPWDGLSGDSSVEKCSRSEG